MVTIIQADYEKLEEVAQLFEGSGEGIAETYAEVKRVYDQLRDGGWIGEGSEAFFAEMGGEVLPAVLRLASALHEASQMTRTISTTMQGAEEEAAALFEKDYMPPQVTGNPARLFAPPRDEPQPGSGGSPPLDPPIPEAVPNPTAMPPYGGMPAPPLYGPPPPSWMDGPEDPANWISGGWTATWGGYDLWRAGHMIRGGFRILPGTTYTDQVIIYGSHSASEAAGLSPFFRHAPSTHPTLNPLLSPRGAAWANLTSKAARGTTLLTVGANAVDYTWGANADHGILSTEFAAANTVDLSTGLGLPAAGAFLGGLAGSWVPVIGTAAGAAVGGGVGAVVDLGFKIFFPDQRDAAIDWVNSSVYEPMAGGAQTLWDQWANGTEPLSAYPELIPDYAPGQIQPTYPINGTITIQSFPPVVSEEPIMPDRPTE